MCVCVCVCVYGGETDDEKENNTTFNTAMNDRCNSIASCPTIEINRELRYIRSTPRTFVNFRRIVYLPRLAFVIGLSFMFKIHRSHVSVYLLFMFLKVGDNTDDTGVKRNLFFNARMAINQRG